MNTPSAPKLKFISLTVTIALGMLTSAQAASFAAHAAGYPLRASDLPTSALRSQLEALPSNALTLALANLSGINFTNNDLAYLRVDNTGGVYFVDSFLPPPNKIPVSTAPSVEETVSPATVVSTFNLHSKPGAAQVMYLDFNGHKITKTAWNSWQNVTTWDAQAFDIDNNPSSFSATELSHIKSIWRRVAEDYAPFNVDITTQQPTTFNSNTGRVLITPGVDKNGVLLPYGNSAGGIAYVGVWGASNFASYYSPAFVYSNMLANSPDYIAEAASHEAGHNLGLSHDGTASQGYYGGHGSGYISWAPIMGVGYNQHVSQWSKGEYTGANNQEDDIAIISSKLTTSTDDHGNTAATATALNITATGQVIATTPINDPANSSPANKGIIQSRTDVDAFSFNTSGGTISLKVLPLREPTNTRGGNLDIKMTIRDGANNILATSTPTTDTHAVVNASLGSGTYYIFIDGVGTANSPYSDYGSLGQYFISGKIPQ